MEFVFLFYRLLTIQLQLYSPTYVSSYARNTGEIALGIDVKTNHGKFITFWLFIHVEMETLDVVREQN